MKLHLSFFLFLFTGLFAFGPQESAAQNLTGIWRGYFFTEGSQQYRFEIQIEQNPKKGISGVSYSYLTTVFYGKATLTGLYNAQSKSALIQEIKTIELRMSGGSTACIMKFLLHHSRSGREEFLEGTYTSKHETSDKEAGIRRGGDCGMGRVYLRKVTTSDFYVEPFLRHKSYKKPTPPASVPSEPVTKAPIQTKPPVKKPATKPKPDTVKRGAAPPVEKHEVKKAEPKSLNIPTITRSRKNELTQTITVKNREITVRLYDNGEIDDDTISVYMDNQLVLSSQRLSASPLILSLKMDEDKSEHVLVMVAENLGRIPPNTSLMIVQDGEKRYQVRITSTEQKNAMVRFRFQEE